MSRTRSQPGADQRTLIGETIIRHTRASELPLSPQHFEFWFNYNSGRHSALSAAADSIAAKSGALSATDIDHLYETYLSPWRNCGTPDASTDRLSTALQSLAATCEDAIGSTRSHREALAAEAARLDDSESPALQDLLSAIDRLVRTTRDSQLRYTLLEARIDAIGREVSVLQKELGAVQAECQIDPTTALVNRATFDQILANALLQVAETRQPMSVILANLDFFSTFNQNFGSAVADQVLRSVALLFKAQMRPGDVVARFGGDAFVALLPQLRAGEAVRHAELFRQAMQAHEFAPHPNGGGRISVSVGVADAIKGDTAEFLLRRAVNGLTVAKHEGRNRVVEMSPDGPIWDANRRM